MFKSSKLSLIIRGIAFAALGILCFCFPIDTMGVFAKIAGVAVSTRPPSAASTP